MIYLGKDEARYVVLVLLLVLLGVSHRSPQVVSPLQAMFVVMGMLLLVAAVVLLRWGRVEVRRSSFAAIVAYFIFLLWAWRSSVAAVVPPFAREYMATYLEGFWVLIASYILLHGNGTAGVSAESAEAEARLRRNSLWLVVGFFVAVAVMASIDALNQYLWKFKHQLEEMERLGLYATKDRLSDGVRHALRERRVSASFGNPNIFCGFLAFSVPFILAGAVAAKKRGVKIGFLVALVLLLIAGYLTQSRAGMLSIVVAGLVMLGAVGWKWIVHRKCWRLAIGAIIVLLILLLVLVVSSLGGIAELGKEGSFIERVTNITTVRERVFYLQSGFGMIGRAPIFGNGLGSYGVLYPQYKILEARESQYAHNFVVQMVVEMGVVGLAVFLAFIVLVVAAARRALKDPEDDSCRVLILAAVVGFAVFLFNSLMEYTFYYREFFLDFCLMSGVLLGLSGGKGKASKGRGRWGYCCVVGLAAASLAFFPCYVVRPF